MKDDLSIKTPKNRMQTTSLSISKKYYNIDNIKLNV